MDLLIEVTKNKTGTDKHNYVKHATLEKGFTEDMQEIASTFEKIKDGHLTYTTEQIAKFLGPKLISYDKLKQPNLIFDETTGIAKMNWVAALPRGAAFGDRGLLERGRRQATCICNDDCELIYMTKEDFSKVLLEVEKMARDKKKKFFCNTVFKNYFSIDTAGKIGGLFYDNKKLNRGNLVYQQGEPSNFVYFIKRGQVQISQQKTEENLIKENKNSELRKKVKKTRKVNLALLLTGEVFGEEEIIKQIPRLCSAVATTDTKVFIMTKHNF